MITSDKLFFRTPLGAAKRPRGQARRAWPRRAKRVGGWVCKNDSIVRVCSPITVPEIPFCLLCLPKIWLTHRHIVYLLYSRYVQCTSITVSSFTYLVKILGLAYLVKGKSYLVQNLSLLGYLVKSFAYLVKSFPYLVKKQG